MNEPTNSNIGLKDQFTVLMEQYEKEILNICFIYLQDLSLAEDALQETFLKAFKNLDRFRGECNEKTWLIRIAINTCKDIRRGAWYRFVNRKITLENLPAQATQSKTENVFITLAIMDLPAKEREVILLHYYENMAVTEVARALGISCAAVSKRLKKARQKLQLVLKGGANDVR